jgi:hypothetical protein
MRVEGLCLPHSCVHMVCACGCVSRVARRVRDSCVCDLLVSTYEDRKLSGT